MAKFSLERNQIIDNLIKHFSFSLEAMNNLILYNQSQYRFEGEQVSIYHRKIYRNCIDKDIYFMYYI